MFACGLAVAVAVAVLVCTVAAVGDFFNAGAFIIFFNFWVKWFD